MTDDDGTTDGGALRKQYEKALADLKAQTEANAELQKQVRGSSVKELFTELKVDPRGVKFYAGEPTKEALAEWLKGDGEIFATPPAATVVQTPGSTVPVVPGAVVPTLPPGVTPEMLAAAQAVAGLVPGAPSAPTADLGALTDKFSQLSPTQPEYGAALNDTWSAIRAESAARVAAGQTF
jgi:hypothetical protein